MRKLWKNNWYLFFISLLLIFGFLLRFINYENRWALAYDQAYNAIIARYSLENFLLPLLGPFSSAGPFQTSGIWFWLVMIGYVLFPFSVNGAWIFLSFISLFFIVGIIFVGTKLVNRQFGIIVGLLACISPSQVAQSVNLTNQTPVSFYALLLIVCIERFLYTKKNIYLFFSGIMVSVAFTTHLQGVLLLFFPLLIIFIFKIKNRNSLLFLIGGLIIPVIPLFIFDIQSNFINSRNMLYYYLFEENKISYEALGRRWITYILYLWPQWLGHMIGGNIYIGYLISMVMSIMSVYYILKKTIPKQIGIYLLFIVLSLLILRYVRTPLFDSYFLFLHPFIFISFGWILYKVFYIKKILFYLIIGIIIFGSFQKNFNEIFFATNFTAKQSEEISQLILAKYQTKKLSIFDYKYESNSISLPLLLYFQRNHIQLNGDVKVGLGNTPKEIALYFQRIPYDGTIELRDLSSSTSAQLQKMNWTYISPEVIYNNSQYWYKNEKN